MLFTNEQNKQNEKNKKKSSVTRNKARGNELLVLISLIDLTRQFGSSYTVSLRTLSQKCGLPSSEIKKHIRSLHKKVIRILQKQFHKPRGIWPFYSIELADDSVIFSDELRLVRLFNFSSITTGEKHHVH